MSRCYYCETRLPPDGGIDSRDPDEDQQYCHDCIGTPRLGVVGCGSSKIDTDEPVPAAELYDSNYFNKKSEYCRERCDAWWIISAEHGVLSPGDKIERYDASLDPSSDVYIGDYEAGRWSVIVSRGLKTRFSFYNPYGTVVLLAGQTYLEHIDDGVFERFRVVDRPFEDTVGIGDQMRVLNQRLEDYQPPGQSDLKQYATDGGDA